MSDDGGPPRVATQPSQALASALPCAQRERRSPPGPRLRCDRTASFRGRRHWRRSRRCSRRRPGSRRLPGSRITGRGAMLSIRRRTSPRHVTASAPHSKRSPAGHHPFHRARPRFGEGELESAKTLGPIRSQVNVGACSRRMRGISGSSHSIPLLFRHSQTSPAGKPSIYCIAASPRSRTAWASAPQILAAGRGWRRACRSASGEACGRRDPRVESQARYSSSARSSAPRARCAWRAACCRCCESRRSARAAGDRRSRSDALTRIGTSSFDPSNGVERTRSRSSRVARA